MRIPMSDSRPSSLSKNWWSITGKADFKFLLNEARLMSTHTYTYLLCHILKIPCLSTVWPLPGPGWDNKIQNHKPRAKGGCNTYELKKILSRSFCLQSVQPPSIFTGSCFVTWHSRSEYATHSAGVESLYPYGKNLFVFCELSSVSTVYNYIMRTRETVKTIVPR